MTYEERLKNVTVLGAAGKMGSGILLLTAVEMTDLSLKPENKGKEFVLNAMDISHTGLSGIMRYLNVQVKKIAEKKTVQLRQMYADRADLIENGEIIDQYVFDVLNVVKPTTRLEASYESTLVFEAVSENPELKNKLFKQILENNPNDPWFFTNTSSVPIGQLDREAKLNGRILGFHFYNPPAVQRLVELIVTDQTVPEMIEFANQYAKKLKKVIVPSNDFAGFIGNGHFMRDALHGIASAEKLAADLAFPAAIFAMNRVSQEFLVRPMGIFQLIDYVGIDVCQYIMKVMDPHLENETLHSALLDRMIDLGVKGGQNPDGSQKDGFLKYQKGRPVAVYNPESKTYQEISEFEETVKSFLDTPAKNIPAWKSLLMDRDKEQALDSYFNAVSDSDTKAAELTKQYIARSREIGKQLVADNVANTDDDVNKVMLTGFYHLYGPINEYLT